MPKTPAPLEYSTSQLTKEFGITTRSIRHYEDIGLLAPTRRGQTRVYSPAQRTRLKLILRGKRFGFSLEEIRQLLDLYHMGDSQLTQLSKTLETAKRHLSDMEAQRRELEEAIGELKDQMKWGADKLASIEKK